MRYKITLNIIESMKICYKLLISKWHKTLHIVTWNDFKILLLNFRMNNLKNWFYNRKHDKFIKCKWYMKQHQKIVIRAHKMEFLLEFYRSLLIVLTSLEIVQIIIMYLQLFEIENTMGLGRCKLFQSTGLI